MDTSSRSRAIATCAMNSDRQRRRPRAGRSLQAAVQIAGALPIAAPVYDKGPNEAWGPELADDHQPERFLDRGARRVICRRHRPTWQTNTETTDKRHVPSPAVLTVQTAAIELISRPWATAGARPAAHAELHREKLKAKRVLECGGRGCGVETRKEGSKVATSSDGSMQEAGERSVEDQASRRPPARAGVESLGQAVEAACRLVGKHPSRWPSMDSKRRQVIHGLCPSSPRNTSAIPNHIVRLQLVQSHPRNGCGSIDANGHRYAEGVRRFRLQCHGGNAATCVRLLGPSRRKQRH
eukprot:scaffold57779_cov30-Tisochrysis_lutea.AAC.7